jgi:hypothetical protein
MKYLFCIGLCILAAQTINAQRHFVEDGRMRIIRTGILGEMGSDGDEGQDNVSKKNAIKLNLSSLAYQTIALQYERALAPKISVAIQGRYMLNQVIPGTSQVSDFSSDTINLFKDFKISSWAITPEFRFYVRNVMKGFYIAPYARIRNIDMSLPINYVDDNSKTQTITTQGSFLSFGGGVMIGSHFHIGKSISLDWFILGGHSMTTNIDISSKTTQALSVNDQQDIRDYLSTTQKPLSSFVKNYKYEVSANELRIKGSMNGIGFRGAGLNLGFRF